jgi:Na+-transporting methylmalonyl-CoA/oxaloacetate decarboxylase gamma subunit
VQSSQKTGAAASSSKLPLIIGLVLLLLLLLGLLIYFLSRRSGSSPSRVIAPAKKDDEEKPKANKLANYAAVQSKQRTTPYADRPVKQTENPFVINPTGPLLLNMFVEDQNTNIGKRNIHSLKSGYSLSVGGGNSDFLIFLVEVPSNIGELRRNANQLTFIPRKHKYFPDLGSNELRDCLNKTIRVISDRNYEIRFRFEMYEDPLAALNRMLNQIKVPG